MKLWKSSAKKLCYCVSSLMDKLINLYKTRNELEKCSSYRRYQIKLVENIQKYASHNEFFKNNFYFLFQFLFSSWQKNFSTKINFDLVYCYGWADVWVNSSIMRKLSFQLSKYVVLNSLTWKCRIVFKDLNKRLQRFIMFFSYKFLKMCCCFVKTYISSSSVINVLSS